MKVNELVQNMGLTVVHMADEQREIGGCYVGDLLSWVMGRAKADDLWFTIMSNINVLAVASLTDVAAVVLAEGVTLEEKELQAAKDKGINVLSSTKSVYDLCVQAGALLR